MPKKITRKKASPVPPDVNREERVTVRLTSDEVRDMGAAARAMGVTLSTWIRVAAIAAMRAREGQS